MFFPDRFEKGTWTGSIHNSLISACDFVLKISPHLVRVAMIATTVALAVFGFPEHALLNLSTTLLSFVKRSGYLPSSVDNIVSPMAEFAGICIPLVIDLDIISKMGAYLSFAIKGYQYLLHSPLGSLLSAKRKIPTPPKPHTISQTKALSHYTEKEIEAMTSSRDNFTVNSSHIYSEHVAQLLPQTKPINNAQRELLFAQFEKEIAQRGIELTSDRKDGLSILKRGFVESMFGDKRPVNCEKFQALLAAMIESLLRDELDFEEKTKELCLIGKSCTEGWLREILFLYQPQSKKIAWAVHHELSSLRSHLVAELIQELQKALEDQKVRGIDFKDLMGGTDNIHLINTFEAAFWAWFRSKRGELYLQTYGVDFLNNWMISFLDVDNPEKKIELMILVITKLLHSGHEMAPAYTSAISDVVRRKVLRRRYLITEKLETNIFNAIKPKVQNLESSRNIQWGAITPWLTDITERGIVDFVSSTGYKEKWVKQDIFGQYYLTEEGVRLLLWDLGIFEPNYLPGVPIPQKKSTPNRTTNPIKV